MAIHSRENETRDYQRKRAPLSQAFLLKRNNGERLDTVSFACNRSIKGLTKTNTAVASKAREECWKKIAECVNSSGSSNVPRTWRQIKTKYKNLLQSAHQRRKKQTQEAQKSPQTLQGGPQSSPAFHVPQELYVEVDGNTMVVVEPHNIVSPQTEIGNKDEMIFKTLYPEGPHEEAENVQTPNLPEASTPRSEEQLVEFESLKYLQKKNIELDNIKKELEIQKLRLEIEKLEYEKKMRQLAK
ncbi:hypothetical protein WMY93_030376 [Mugilogobius chulae]|uniref:Myb/SANT-like DNA-binding domain-containing protein n=1 Tax=Mugilogobius chulae TaxID=88201 RepID=A0AAW0MFC1_9GOBI